MNCQILLEMAENKSYNFSYFLSILSWNDSISSLKATLLMGPMVRYMASEQILNPSLASNLMIAVLQAFQVHGVHDSNQVRRVT